MEYVSLQSIRLYMENYTINSLQRTISLSYWPCLTGQPGMVHQSYVLYVNSITGGLCPCTLANVH
jgi:hypothetical protein